MIKRKLRWKKALMIILGVIVIFYVFVIIYNLTRGKLHHVPETIDF